MDKRKTITATQEHGELSGGFRKRKILECFEEALDPLTRPEKILARHPLFGVELQEKMPQAVNRRLSASSPKRERYLTRND